MPEIRVVNGMQFTSESWTLLNVPPSKVVCDDRFFNKTTFFYSVGELHLTSLLVGMTVYIVNVLVITKLQVLG